MTQKITVDITPHPQILSVLGEIEFKPWQCIAELIDNSADSFILASKSGSPINAPVVNVAIGTDTVVVKDNGPGMSLEILEHAVKAGWGSQERFGSLGLYGVGFNIATARLGKTTTIWTSEAGGDVWYGLEIDLGELRRGGSYRLEVKTRQKSIPEDSGTEIEVRNIRADWRQNLSSSQWIRWNINNRLSRVYSTMLRTTNPQPIGFSLLMNNRRVSAWEHCVWPEDWEVFRRSEGLIRPVQQIDITFGKKYLSKETKELYDSPETLDEEDIIEIPERVYGWLGIQRYAHTSDYGVDILRNGRKIEVGCKDIFNWEGDEGEIVIEYPIDDPRQRGRIVGELHLDHGYVHYTKHRFEREHTSWKQLIKAVRNDEPLTNRGRHGFSGDNASPLGVLFRTFRRQQPYRGQTYWDILVLKENDKAEQWAIEYRKGTAAYRDNRKWREEIEKQDSPPVDDDEGVDGGQTEGRDGNGDADGAGERDFILEGGAEEEPQESGDQQSPTLTREPLPSLSLQIDGVGPSGRSYSVETYSVESGDGGSAWSGKLTERNVYEIDLNLQHPAFNTTSLRARDAILADVAHLITSEEASVIGRNDSVNYGDILVVLRRRFAATASLEPNNLRMAVDDLRTKLTKRLSDYLETSDQQEELISQLPAEDINRIRFSFGSGPETKQLVEYLEMSHLAYLFGLNPQLFFAAGCFSQSWTPDRLTSNEDLLVQYRQRLVQSLSSLLMEAGEFSRSLTTANHSLAFRTYIRACLDLLDEHLSV